MRAQRKRLKGEFFVRVMLCNEGKIVAHVLLGNLPNYSVFKSTTQRNYITSNESLF